MVYHADLVDVQRTAHGILQRPLFAALLNIASILVGNTVLKGGNRMNTRPIVFLGNPSVPLPLHPTVSLAGSQVHLVQLHTLEDFTAHSNFCELALVSMGHSNVFVHVGDNVRIQAPNGRWVAPLVTGTFGSSDFLHSLLGGKSSI
jgi:hypothetical protein